MAKNINLILEATRRRNKELYEYSFYRHGTTEAGEPNQQGAMPPAGGNNSAPVDPMAGGQDPMAGGDPNAMGSADPMAGGANQDPNAMGGGMDPMTGGDPNAMAGGQDPMAGGDPNAMGGADPMAGGADQGMNLAPNAGMDGADPMAGGQDPIAGADMGMDGSQPGPDDDVIDITQLTDAQDQMQQNQDEQNQKLDDIDSHLAMLMKVVDKFTQALDDNDAKLNDLKKEIEKRNPTEEETMNVRLHAGGNPFDQKPEEFWDKFEDINNHYNITSNNDAPQYQLRKADIDSFNDRNVSKEFDEIPSSLKEYFTR